MTTGGLICRDITTDATEAEANARMFHDCEPGESCPGLKNQRKRKNNEREFVRAAARMETSEARKIRGAAAETLPDDEHAPIAGDADALVHDSDGNLLRIRCAGHWWRITDPTAGCRTKEGKRGGVTTFIGHTDLKMDSTLVGLSIVRVLGSASTQEYDLYPAAYENLKYILGGVPRSVIADKGLSIKRIFQMHSDDGVFSVMPFRGSNAEPLPVDRERWDRYGRPRRENCGGRTRFSSFAKTPQARVYFECTTKPYAECKGRQQLQCSEDPRFILPLWRGTPLYEALEDSGMEYERTHRLTRERHGSGSTRRKGRDWQQLHANASIVSDWLKLCWRNGWLPGTSAQTSLDVTHFEGEEKSGEFEERYQDKGLTGYYGERAAALGKGPWRVAQYRRAELKDAPSQAAPARPRGGPRRRALTKLPSNAPDLVKRARKQFFAAQAAHGFGGGAAAKGAAKKSAAKATGQAKSAGSAKVPTVGELQRQRAQRARAKKKPDPPA